MKKSNPYQPTELQLAIVNAEKLRPDAEKYNFFYAHDGFTVIKVHTDTGKIVYID